MLKVELLRSDAVLERLGNVPSRYVAGSFEWAQITYDELRVSPDGDTIARFDTNDDVWRLTDRSGRLNSGQIAGWSDVVISPC